MNVEMSILMVADELTEPRQHVERVRVGWTKSRNPIFRTHITVQPGLLQQLYDAAVDPVANPGEPGGHAAPESRPPLAFEALGTYREICDGAVRWMRSFRLDLRDTPESNIRALVGLRGQLDLDTLEELLQDLKTWRRWCAVMTGWESKVFRPRVECPVCGTWQSIRANPAAWAAFCTECQHWWEGDDELRATFQKVAA